MSDTISDAEPPILKKRIVTRCYIDLSGTPDQTAYILRTHGRPDTVVTFPATIDAEVARALVRDAIARLLLAGASKEDILSGKAPPTRALPPERAPAAPKPKALTKLQRAISAVRLAEVLTGLRKQGEKITKELREARAVEIDQWARDLTPEILAQLQKLEAVQIELAKLGPAKSCSIGDLLAAGAPPPAAPDDTAAS